MPRLKCFSPRTVTFDPSEQTMDGGADYMERNAMVLVELIQRTNGVWAFQKILFSTLNLTNT